MHRRTPPHRLRRLAVALAFAFAPLAGGVAHAQSAFTPLDDLAGGGFLSVAHSVSGDGSVVVGEGESASGTEAFRWTQAGGMAGLGDLAGGGFESRAYGTNSDGSVVVGYGKSASGTEAFRWTQAGSMVGLGDLAGGGFASSAMGTSSDGSVVVGYGTSASGTEAFRWTQAGGMVGLGDLAGGSFSSLASGVSGDGSVVVGRSSSANGTEAFRWTQAGGMVGLGDLAGGGFESRAYSTNSDGSVVVGSGTSASGFEAFRWTEAAGMQRVADWLAAAGVTVAAGYTMTAASSVSADGSVVVGVSTGPSGTEAFLARVSSIGSGAITLSDVRTSLAGTAGGGSMALAAAGTVLNGAHSRPLSKRVAAGQRTFWLAGDWGRDDHGSRDGALGLAEFGLGQNFGPVQINISLGQTWAKQHQALNGRTKSDGTYLLAQALVPLRGNLWATFGGHVHRGQADMRRGYLNAGTQDYSTGTPDADTWGLRARLEWDKAYRVASADFSPYVDLTYSEAKLDGYTETGGGFPARFDSRKETATELRVGVNAERPLANGAKLFGVLEAAHRFEKAGARTSGNVIGLFGFALDGQKNDRDWLRVGAGVEGKLAEGRASLSLNLTTKGEVPNAWLAAGWQKAF
jgi:probable HAF family extracellular repeat protein